MRSFPISILTILLFASLAQADTLFQLKVPQSTGFLDNSATQAGLNSVLFIDNSGNATWASAGKLQSQKTYVVVNKECTPDSQDTSMDGPAAGMTLAKPFLVGIGRVCYLDEAAGSLRLIADFVSKLPENPYSVVFAGEDATSSYFLINGRPSQGEGYLFLVSINKKSLDVSKRQLVNQVPGYSGAMAFTKNNIWLTAWTGANDIYKLSSSAMLALIQSGGQADFSAIARKLVLGIDGMSLFIVANDTSLLYYNKGYDSFIVDQTSGIASPIKPTCTPVAGLNAQWLVLCDGKSVQTWLPQ